MKEACRPLGFHHSSFSGTPPGCSTIRHGFPVVVPPPFALNDHRLPSANPPGLAPGSAVEFSRKCPNSSPGSSGSGGWGPAEPLGCNDKASEKPGAGWVQSACGALMTAGILQDSAAGRQQFER